MPKEDGKLSCLSKTASLENQRIKGCELYSQPLILLLFP